MNEMIDSIADTALDVRQSLIQPDDVRVFRDIILAKLTYDVGKDQATASSDDWLRALSLALRDHIVDSWMATSRRAYRTSGKRVYYLSLEFLIGRLLKDGLNNMGLLDTARAALDSVGVDFDLVAELEPDAALGNGGLGRLAACFMESMATVGVPAYGYGIRYENGSAKILTMAGRPRRPRTGSPSAIPGSFSGAKSPTRSASVGRLMLRRKTALQRRRPGGRPKRY
jgi:hypothetical protein